MLNSQLMQIIYGYNCIDMNLPFPIEWLQLKVPEQYPSLKKRYILIKAKDRKVDAEENTRLKHKIR